MSAMTTKSATRGYTLQVLVSLLITLAAVPAGLATPPIDPLPAPNYSFDLQSPTVIEGIVDAGDVLALDFPHPWPEVPGPFLGLLSPYDNLDALSSPNTEGTAGETFVLLFSVDRQTTGETPPDPLLVELGVPYNVFDQAFRGHAAGDQFMSTELFARWGRVARGGSRTSSSSLDRNNYDEGGTDFSAVPPTSAASYTGTGPQPGRGLVPQDNVNATGLLDRAAPDGEIVNVYFTAWEGSPSLYETLPGSEFPSGATVFYNAAPTGGATSELYATFEMLGLQQADDIDAMLVLDELGDNVFSDMDVVIFSLAPGSPSLEMIPGATPGAAAADVFFAMPWMPPEVFISAAELGMGVPGDNIDALELFYCTDALDCVLQHSIRGYLGDMNCDGEVNFFDIDGFVLALMEPEEYYLVYPDCDRLRADCNQDGQVNFFDITPFVTLITEPDP